jgi:hypothetical protein
MKIASSPTQIAAQTLANNAASLRPQAVPRRIQTADLVELTKPGPQTATMAVPAARETQISSIAAPPPRESQPTPARATRPGSLLDIKI